MKTIGILTSSRADFGIYLPLLQQLKQKPDYRVSIIAFGTHLSNFHGYTIKAIEDLGFKVDYTVESILLTDTPSSIASSIGLTTLKFADFWKNTSKVFDIVFCLGDRYEMFAAVMAGISFQIPFAHIHGGETTLGAIDNVFRHSITLSSKYHFVSTEIYKQKVVAITGSDENVFNVGALGLDNLSTIKTLSLEEFKHKWGIDLAKKTILTTFHPETVNFTQNRFFAQELIHALKTLSSYQILITLPNNDTAGNEIRQLLVDHFHKSDRVFLIENLGTASYFTAMANCAFMLGNTSSGIIEAASFGKYVINLGDRQKGRMSGENVLNVPVLTDAILAAVHLIEEKVMPVDENIYFNGGAANRILETLLKVKQEND